ncbi:MAG: response regulator transcription factor [Cytophagales bacterium]|nr:response regulator transcription factor [Cytophagales bacterium]
MPRALVIEDDLQIAELIKIHLKDLHYVIDHTVDGLEGYEMSRKTNYCLIILDIMLPTLDGIEVCRMMRSKNVSSPIIMVTAKSEEIDRVLGLETGADDYVVKPFGVREFQARVKAVLRRSQGKFEENAGQNTNLLNFQGIRIDLDKRSVNKGQLRIELTPKEFDLLALLANSPGKSFNRQSLLNLVWGYDFEGYEHTVNSHINRIRAKIEEDMNKPNFILTSWGYGYRFNENI